MDVAVGLALLIAFCHLRFRWWPLHPVMFIFLGAFQGQLMGFSFLLGWAVKTATTRYGGARAYLRLKPLMIGIIAGEMVAGNVLGKGYTAGVGMSIGTAFGRIVGVNAAASTGHAHPTFKEEFAYAAGR